MSERASASAAQVLKYHTRARQFRFFCMRAATLAAVLKKKRKRDWHPLGRIRWKFTLRLINKRYRRQQLLSNYALAGERQQNVSVFVSRATCRAGWATIRLNIRTHTLVIVVNSAERNVKLSTFIFYVRLCIQRAEFQINTVLCKNLLFSFGMRIWRKFWNKLLNVDWNSIGWSEAPECAISIEKPRFV